MNRHANVGLSADSEPLWKGETDDSLSKNLIFIFLHY